MVETPIQSASESHIIISSQIQSIIDTPLVVNSSSIQCSSPAPITDPPPDTKTPTRVASGRARYGWKHNGTRTLFIHDEDQQRNIELVKDFKVSKPNLTFNAISNQMNFMGIPARIVLDKEGQIIRQTKFNPSLIQSILADAGLVHGQVY